MTNRSISLRRRFWLQVLEDRRTPATFYVTAPSAPDNVGSPVPGSLRDAVNQANNSPNTIGQPDDIFIVKMGTMTLVAPLVVSDAVNIDPYGASEAIIKAPPSGMIFNIDDCNPTIAMPVMFKGLTFMGASNGSGGGIFVQGEDLTIDSCVITGNSATNGSGGGIFFNGGQGSHLTIRNSTISGNTATGSGGGIYVTGSANVLIQNSTISGNSAGGSGGGIAVNLNGPVASFVVQNSTITANSAGNGSLGGGGMFASPNAPPPLIQSSIISGNNQGGVPQDISAGTVNFDHSAVGSANGFMVGSSIATLFGANLDLGPLADNGGQTPTHALGPNSAAIGTGSNPANLQFDQRGDGFPRFESATGQADIGAYEHSFAPYAKSKRADVSVAGGNAYSVVVTYTDENAIKASSIDVGDITVTGPDGANYSPVGFVANPPVDAAVVIVTYFFVPPGGTWDAGDNGTYTATMNPNQVSDIDPTPHFVPAGSLGSFVVNIPPPNVVVDELGDADDGDLGVGHVSIREAVKYFPGASVTFSPVVFSSPQTITLTAASGPLSIPVPVTVIGPPAQLTLDGNNVTRIFNVDAPGAGNVISLNGLTLINGNATTSSGGGIQVVDENLTLTNVSITNCTAVTGGGGIEVTGNGGTLTLSNCTISNCSTTGFSTGGGIDYTGTGTLIVRSSNIANNKSAQDGGGIYMHLDSTLDVQDSTISGNTADVTFSYFGGGGIFFYHAGNFTVRNCTIANNVADSGEGGGIVFRNLMITAQIFNSTITGNTALLGGGIARTTGTGTVQLQSTIVAQNVATFTEGPDLFFTNPANVSGNNNLVGVADSGNFTLTGTGNLTGSLANPLDPMLGMLANNGGPTLTEALLAGSPAINAGNITGGGLIYDQRGPSFFRVRGGQADIGAFENQFGAPPPTIALIVVNNGAVQRSRVTSIIVTFDQIVTLPPTVTDAFKLVRQSDGAMVTLAASVSGTSVTLSFTGGAVDANSLADGRYSLTVFSYNVFNSNGQLDGNNDGFNENCDAFMLVGTPNNGLFRLFGDVDGNGTVNAQDFLAFRTAFGGNGNVFDFNNNGTVDAADFLAFRSRFGSSI